MPKIVNQKSAIDHPRFTPQSCPDSYVRGICNILPRSNLMEIEAVRKSLELQLAEINRLPSALLREAFSGGS